MLRVDGFTCECKAPYIDDGTGGCACSKPEGCSTPECHYPLIETPSGCACGPQFEEDGSGGG
jgi:hypothetical protein